MARAKFEDIDVIRVGIALRDAGHPVNGWALRRKLGGGKSERLMQVWQASPEGRRHIQKAAKGRIDPKAVQKALDTIKDAALAALNELDGVVSARMERQDEHHAAELISATRWAEGLDEMVEHQLADWSERAAEANGRATAVAQRAAKAEAEAAAVPGLRLEVAGLREMLETARQAEASLRAEVDAVRAEVGAAAAARDEALTRAMASEDRARAALERAARAEGALEALRASPTR